MMAALWADVAADLASATRHFGKAVALYDRELAQRSGPAAYVPAMAFQHAMQSGYTSFEAGMKRLLLLLDEPTPLGPDSPIALLRRIGEAIPGERPAILDADLLAQVAELRRFRHVAMHGYDDFDPRRAVISVDAARAFVSGIDGAIARFRASIDPAA